MTYEWDDLSDDELLYRLIMRGIPDGQARRWVKDRDHQPERSYIEQVIG